jgi:AcrR family transcriptional regulator
MREVAAASGILAGSLYHHFASKEAIAVELVEEYHADLVRVVRDFGPTRPDPVAALRGFAREIADTSFRHRAALQISMFDAPSTASASLKTVVHAEPAAVDRHWRTLISAAVVGGAMGERIDPRILRHVLHRTTLQVGLAAWEWAPDSEPRAVADCVTAIIFDGLAVSTSPCADKSAASQAVEAARARWTGEAAQRQQQRPGTILDVARGQFALRGFEATTMRDIADASGITASNLYRYFDSKDSMLMEILGNFSDQLLDAYREVLQAGSPVVDTLDAILWLLDCAGRHFSREIDILPGFSRLLPPAVANRYGKGAQARFSMLTNLIDAGVQAGDLNPVAQPALVASCLREIMWSPMRNLAPISPQRVRDFYRHSVLFGASAARG